jgi:hypothetical protein
MLEYLFNKKLNKTLKLNFYDIIILLKLELKLNNGFIRIKYRVK